MSSSCFIVTSTGELRLDSLSEKLRSKGIPVADPDRVRGINQEILKTRGLSWTAPIASPSYHPAAEAVSAVARDVATLVNALESSSVLVDGAFPLTISDWISADLAAVLCLTTDGMPEVGGSAVGDEPPACRQAYKYFQRHRLANSGLAVVFLNVGGLPETEVTDRVENFLRRPEEAIERETDLDSLQAIAGSGSSELGASLFRIRSATPLPRWVFEELEHWRRRQIQQAALRDRFGVYEKELNKRTD